MPLPKEWPHFVKAGDIRIPIYHSQRTKKGKPYAEFKVVYRDKEKIRRFKTFADFDNAKEFAKDVCGIRTASDVPPVILTQDEGLIYRRAKDALAPYPDAVIDEVVREWVELRQMLKGTRPRVAGEFFVKHGGDVTEKTVPDVVAEFVQLRQTRTKKGGAASDKYLSDLEQRLGKFAVAFTVPISQVTPGQIDEWVTGLKQKNGNHIEGRTRFNYLRLIRTLFMYAQSKKYFPKNVNPMDGIEMGYDDDGEIAIFTPEELSRLLRVARPEMIPFVAIGAFAGLRTAEIQRLDWSEVGADFIEIKAKKAKTRSRRLVPVQPNLAQWLAPYRQKCGPVVEFVKVSSQVQWLAESTAEEGKPAVQWKHNGLRHSYITYRMAELKDENTVAIEAGNSPAMIFQHYREIVRPEMAKTWFSIVPKSAENVIPLAQAEG